MQQELFQGSGVKSEISPADGKPMLGAGLTCLTCEHRERHQCGGSIIQYCGVRKSNRTYNGQLKIKCKTPACAVYKPCT